MTATWLYALVFTSALAGCLDVGHNRCGPNMRFADALGACVCIDNAVADLGGCTACADDEVVIGEVCTCAPGQAKGEAGLCTTAEGLGTPCDATTTCTNPAYDYCAVRGDLGSCTQRCALDADCPEAYVCADWEATPSCRTFTGYGTTCTGPGDCAGLDAGACIQGYCVVQGCSIGLDDCPRDTVCCDFSGYGLGTICTPEAACS